MLDAARFKTVLEKFTTLFGAGGWMPLAGASPFWTVHTFTQQRDQDQATHYHFIQEVPMLPSYKVCACDQKMGILPSPEITSSC
jgi:hypothetical protein